MVILLGHLELLVILLGHLKLLLQGKPACLQSLGNHLVMARLSIMSKRCDCTVSFFITCLRDLCELGCLCTGNKNGLLLPNSTSDQGKSSLHLIQPPVISPITVWLIGMHCYQSICVLTILDCAHGTQNGRDPMHKGDHRHAASPILPLQLCQKSLKASLRCRIATHQE